MAAKLPEAATTALVWAGTSRLEQADREDAETASR